MNRHVDPSRLLRALGLEVEGLASDRYQVTGGREPHAVRIRDGESWACDCEDALYHPAVRCKHMIATYLARQLAAPVRRALRTTLGDKSMNPRRSDVGISVT